VFLKFFFLKRAIGRDVDINLQHQKRLAERMQLRERIEQREKEKKEMEEKEKEKEEEKQARGSTVTGGSIAVTGSVERPARQQSVNLSFSVAYNQNSRDSDSTCDLRDWTPSVPKKNQITTDHDEKKHDGAHVSGEEKAHVGSTEKDQEPGEVKVRATADTAKTAI
jgi:hypothetical protein